MKVVCMQKLFRIFAHLFVFWDRVSLCNLDCPKTHYVNDVLELKEIYVPLTLEFWDYQCHSNYLVVKFFKIRLTTKKKKNAKRLMMFVDSISILGSFSWNFQGCELAKHFSENLTYIKYIHFLCIHFSTVPLKTHIV